MRLYGTGYYCYSNLFCWDYMKGRGLQRQEHILLRSLPLDFQYSCSRLQDKGRSSRSDSSLEEHPTAFPVKTRRCSICGGMKERRKKEGERVYRREDLGMGEGRYRREGREREELGATV